MSVYDHTVEEGQSTQFKCDSNATSPFYYYKYVVKDMSPLIMAAATQGELPWAVYAINASTSSVNIQPSFLTRSDHPFYVTNITITEFNNALVCCQGYQNASRGWLKNDQSVTSLSVMICYRVNIQCK